MSIVTLNDRAVRSVTTFGSVSGGSMVFIKILLYRFLERVFIGFRNINH